MFGRGAWLGQVPLILGPSSWGAGGIPVVVEPFHKLDGPWPPFYGEWAAFGYGHGTVGPFATQDEAFRAAVKAAGDAGAKSLPADGWAQVKDSIGNPVGPVT